MCNWECIIISELDYEKLYYVDPPLQLEWTIPKTNSTIDPMDKGIILLAPHGHTLSDPLDMYRLYQITFMLFIYPLIGHYPFS